MKPAPFEYHRPTTVAEAAEQIGDPSVRNRGTLGGSVGEADPAGNHPAALVALDANLELVSADGERTVPVSDYFIAYMFTDLGEDELVAAASSTIISSA